MLHLENSYYPLVIRRTQVRDTDLRQTMAKRLLIERSIVRKLGCRSDIFRANDKGIITGIRIGFEEVQRMRDMRRQTRRDASIAKTGRSS
jgi:hypothetical protein